STPNTLSPVEIAKPLVMRWPALRRRLPSACFPEASDEASGYHPYRYHHPLPLGELRSGLEAAGFRVLGQRRFLWVVKVLPDALMEAGTRLGWLDESVPTERRFVVPALVGGVS